MAYQHIWSNGSSNSSSVELPVGKVVCVGRNYAAHAKELNNPIPTEPLLFMKPATAMVPLNEPIRVPSNFGECHYETEIALLIGQSINQGGHQNDDLLESIAGVGLALDLTLRTLQNQLKEKGHPWEKAKAFDGACPISAFVPLSEVADLNALTLRSSLNQKLRQQGGVADMLTPPLALLAYIRRFFSLLPGDVVLTGTPQGVGALTCGDVFQLELLEGDRSILNCTTSVA